METLKKRSGTRLAGAVSPSVSNLFGRFQRPPVRLEEIFRSPPVPPRYAHVYALEAQTKGRRRLFANFPTSLPSSGRRGGATEPCHTALESPRRGLSGMVRLVSVG
jgi:hypothetical protein